MPCFQPVKANLISYVGGRCVQINPYGWEEGRVDVAPFDWFVKKNGQYIPVLAYRSESILLPCGKCEGCLIARSREWACRCMHEAKKHDKNCFLTLTYDDDHLPLNNKLNRRDLQLFIKRLRKSLSPKRISFFYCGEYGERNKRPHYHIIVFGWSPDDLMVSFNENGSSFVKSLSLARLWRYGFVSVGKLTFQSASYTARYALKKIDDQECFQGCSTRPAIGLTFANSYAIENSERGFSFVDGKKTKVPRYYDKVSERLDPVKFREIKKFRLEHVQPYNPEKLRSLHAHFQFLKKISRKDRWKL